MYNIQQLHKVSEQEGQQSKVFAIYFNKDTAGTYVLWLGNILSGSCVVGFITSSVFNEEHWEANDHGESDLINRIIHSLKHY